MLTLSETVVPLPVRGGAAHWSAGTAVIAVPGSSEVLLSPPSAASRAPWAAVDVDSLTVRTGSGMPGPLRDVHFPGPEAEDGRWWVLGLHGLGRLAPGAAIVEDVVRQEVGRYPHRLIPLGTGRLGVGTRLSPNLIVVPRGERVVRLRAADAVTSVPLEDGRVRVLAPAAGKAYDVDPVLLKVVRRHAIPVGTGARLVGGRLVYLAGESVPITILAAHEEPRPGVPVVLGTGSEVGERVGRTVVPRAVVVLDVLTLDAGPLLTNMPVGHDAVEVLGTDADGNVVIGTRDGFDVVAREGGSLLGRHREERGIVGAGMLPGRNVVVLASCREPLGSLVVVRW